jgi:hypothetical protein
MSFVLPRWDESEVYTAGTVASDRMENIVFFLPKESELP